MSAVAALYTREVLALATSLSAWPLDPALPLAGHARAPTCGSTLDLGFALDSAGAIERVGLRARACAIGQAAAAIFANAATGRTSADIFAAATEIEQWLEGGSAPSWPGLDSIAPARDYPARHGAILLAWRAALVALEQRG